MADARQTPAAADPLGIGGVRAADDAGLSLDQLSAAFAEMLRSGADPYAEPPAAAPAQAAAAPAEPEPADDPVGESPGDAACEICPRTIVEALVFVGLPGGEPLSAEQMARSMRGVRPAEVHELVRELNGRYAASRCPYRIMSVGAGYRLEVTDEHAPLRQRLAERSREARLSPAALEVLALAAYEGPLTAAEMAARRDAPSRAILAQLVRRGLLRIEAAEDRPRERRYAVTPRFLELFGLGGVEDLPRSQDLERR